MTVDVDVAIVGFGPAGEMLASLLGQRDHSIVAYDKFPHPYGLPRMSTIDGEIARVLQTASNPADALKDTMPEYYAELWGADGEKKGQFDWNYKRAGHYSHLSVHQPNIEKAMEERIAEWPNVEIRWGRTVDKIEKDGDVYRVSATKEDGSTESITATYVVGMDGARSFVRGELGLDVDVIHLHDDRWVLTDYDVVKPLPRDLENRVYVDLDLEVPYFWGPNGKGRVRTDVRLRPDADEEETMNPELGFDFLVDRVGIDRDSVTQTRRKIYTFRSQLATGMKVGNAFIGGDAAHAMTPYMGQGACTAMRDSANLSWKLDLVLRGLAAPELLDTYESERLNHAQFFVHGSLAAYKMINPSGPEEAAGRDAYLEATGGDVTPPIPALREGIQFRDADGEYTTQAGNVAPQGIVTHDGKTDLLDNIIGGGFHIVSTIPLKDALSAEQRARLEELRTTFVHIGGDFEDTDGTYAEYFGKHGGTTLVSRPDVYIFGLADGEEASVALIDDLLTQIPRA